MVVYPHGVQPLFVGTKRSIAALEAAMANDKQILIVTKRDADAEDPSEDDVFQVGTLSTVLQLLKLPDGTEIPPPIFRPVSSIRMAIRFFRTGKTRMRKADLRIAV